MASGFLVSSTEPASARIFALARHGEAERDGEQAGDDEDRDRDEDEDDGGATATAALAAAARTAAAAPSAPPPPPLLRPEVDHRSARGARMRRSPTSEMMPTKTAAMTSKLNVAVLDVGELVAEHGLKLGVVERVHQAARDGDRILALAHAAGEGVARVGLDDAELRHGDAAADAQRLEEILQARLGARGRPCGRR